jgi:cytochrome c oxidase assembly protein subunit 15
MSEIARARFQRLAWAVLAYTVLVILFGAWVRITGSGAGCGEHWPSCHGELVPRSPSIATVIEFTHRVTSGLCLFAVLVAGVGGAAEFSGRARGAARGGAGGAVHDHRGAGRRGARALRAGRQERLDRARGGDGDPPGEHVAADRGDHLRGVSRATRGDRTAAAAGGAVARDGDRGAAGGRDQRGGHGARRHAVSGAGRRSRGRLAEDHGAGAHFLQRLRVFHPFIAVGLGLYVLVVANALSGPQASAAARRWGGVVMLGVLVQVAAGVVNILLSAPGWLQVVHLLLGTGLWIALITFALTVLGPRRT